MSLTVTDLFCGGGGSSTGAIHEVAAGMAFPADYIWGGTRRERVKLCGNAVTPPAARDLIAAVAESLGGAA